MGLATRCIAVYVVGNYAYVVGGFDVRVISVADKSSPMEVGFRQIPGLANGIHVIGDYAYVICYDWVKGLRVISVADKSNPMEAGFFETPGYPGDVHVVGDYAYVAADEGGLLILRIVKPEYRVYLPIVGLLALR